MIVRRSGRPFDDLSIRAGVRGVTSVLEHLGTLTPRKRPRKKRPPIQVASERSWACAPASGMIIGLQTLTSVYEGDAIIHIAGFEALDAAEVMADRFEERILGASGSQA